MEQRAPPAADRATRSLFDAADAGERAGIPSAEHPAQPPGGSPLEVEAVPRTLLAGSPREVLARIVPGDPLRLRDRVADALREAAVFLDADRVHLRALALTARAAPRYRGRPELAQWLAGIAAGAVTEILREDAEALPADPGSAFVQLTRPLGLEAEALRRGCAAFNRLPAPDRAALFGVLIHARTLDDLAHAEGQSASEMGRRARRALDAVLHANHPDLPPVRRPGVPPARTGNG